MSGPPPALGMRPFSASVAAAASSRLALCSAVNTRRDKEWRATDFSASRAAAWGVGCALFDRGSTILSLAPEAGKLFALCAG